MFIQPGGRAPSRLLKVGMTVYLGKWTVGPERNQGDKTLIVFGEQMPSIFNKERNQSAWAREHLEVWG